MRRRMVMADAPVLYRIRLTRISPSGETHEWFEGPYPKPAAARGRLTFWQGHYAKERPGWTVSGFPEECPMNWRPSKD